MKTSRLISFGLALAASSTLAHASITLDVTGYTSNSLDFVLTGSMPSTSSGFPNANDHTGQLDLVFSPGLWLGNNTPVAISVSGSPLTAATNFHRGNIGDWNGLPYVWMTWTNDLTSALGTGSTVEITWQGNKLNTNGTGTISLYWGNVFDGIDPTGNNNELLASTNVPEPASMALFAFGLAGLGLRRQRKTLDGMKG